MITEAPILMPFSIRYGHLWFHWQKTSICRDFRTLSSDQRYYHLMRADNKPIFPHSGEYLEFALWWNVVFLCNRGFWGPDLRQSKALHKRSGRDCPCDKDHIDLMSSVDKIKGDWKKAETRLSKATPKVSGRAEEKKTPSSLHSLPSTAALSLIRGPVLIGN